MSMFDQLHLLEDVRRINKRQLLYQVLNFAMIVSLVLMIWKGLIAVSEGESPIIVILRRLSVLHSPSYRCLAYSSSVPGHLQMTCQGMGTGFSRGDVLLLTNHSDEPIRAGEIVVFKIKGRDIPIVHRVIKVHEKEDGTTKILTKGDNNVVDDRGLYPPGQMWLKRSDIIGRARGLLPYVGFVAILMSDYPKFKYAVVASLGIFVFLRGKAN